MKPKPFTIVVNVTKKDIEKGMPLSACCCPIAIALRRAFPKLAGVRVCHHRVRIVHTEPGLRFLYATPTRRMSGFMESFDLGLTVKPAKFRLTFRPWKQP